jgi:hypothetical protein
MPVNTLNDERRSSTSIGPDNATALGQAHCARKSNESDANTWIIALAIVQVVFRQGLEGRLVGITPSDRLHVLYFMPVYSNKFSKVSSRVGKGTNARRSSIFSFQDLPRQ